MKSPAIVRVRSDSSDLYIGLTHMSDESGYFSHDDVHVRRISNLVLRTAEDTFADLFGLRSIFEGEEQSGVSLVHVITVAHLTDDEWNRGCVKSLSASRPSSAYQHA